MKIARILDGILNDPKKKRDTNDNSNVVDGCARALLTLVDGVRPASDCDAIILRNTYGDPLTYPTMAAMMRTESARLCLSVYDLHGLRYRGVMELAWAGCTDDKIVAYSGHASKDMIRKYAGEARQIMQTRSARDKRA